MNVIILESVLFFALVAVVGALIVYAVRQTRFGQRFRQSANRRRIDGQVDLTCPIHGLQEASRMVRLPTGEVLCPHCYQEVVHGVVD